MNPNSNSDLNALLHKLSKIIFLQIPQIKHDSADYKQREYSTECLLPISVYSHGGRVVESRILMVVPIFVCSEGHGLFKPLLMLSFFKMQEQIFLNLNEYDYCYSK